MTGRSDVVRILNGQDNRLLVIVEPVALSDLLLAVRLEQQYPELFIMILCGPELITEIATSANGQQTGGVHPTNTQLRATRSLMMSLTAAGVRLAIQASNSLEAMFVEDLASVMLVPNSTLSCLQMASSMSCPVGITSPRDQDRSAVTEVLDTVNKSHCFLGISPEGMATIVQSAGNPQSFAIASWVDFCSTDSSPAVRSISQDVRAKQRLKKMLVDYRENSNHGQRSYKQVLESMCAHLALDTLDLAGLIVSLDSKSAKSTGLMDAKIFFDSLVLLNQHGS